MPEASLLNCSQTIPVICFTAKNTKEVTKLTKIFLVVFVVNNLVVSARQFER